jgi:hypothetical protein
MHLPPGTAWAILCAAPSPAPSSLFKAKAPHLAGVADAILAQIQVNEAVESLQAERARELVLGQAEHGDVAEGQVQRGQTREIVPGKV